MCAAAARAERRTQRRAPTVNAQTALNLVSLFASRTAERSDAAGVVGPRLFARRRRRRASRSTRYARVNGNVDA